jgi:hypothetical protein
MASTIRDACGEEAEKRTEDRRKEEEVLRKHEEFLKR